MKSQQNQCDSSLMRDIETFKGDAIYIRRFYAAQKATNIFEKLQNELDEKLASGETVIEKGCQMVFYAKMTKKTEKKLNGANMFYNRYFSETFRAIIEDLMLYFDVLP